MDRAVRQVSHMLEKVLLRRMPLLFCWLLSFNNCQLLHCCFHSLSGRQAQQKESLTGLCVRLFVIVGITITTWQLKFPRLALLTQDLISFAIVEGKTNQPGLFCHSDQRSLTNGPLSLNILFQLTVSVFMLWSCFFSRPPSCQCSGRQWTISPSPLAWPCAAWQVFTVMKLRKGHCSWCLSNKNFQFLATEVHDASSTRWLWNTSTKFH